MSKDNEELEFLDQQADAWLKVARLLDELSPNWVTKDKSGVEAALEAIREFAAKKQAEPVAWRYKVNNTHTCFSEIEPPDDAYDEGTLVALYLAPAVAVNEPERFENDAAWDLANKVRKDLDRKCCPGPFMDLAMEAINRHYKHASQCVDVDDKVVSALKGAAKALNKIDDWLKGRGYSGLKPSEIIILDELNAAIAAAEAVKKGACDG